MIISLQLCFDSTCQKHIKHIAIYGSQMALRQIYGNQLNFNGRFNDIDWFSLIFIIAVFFVCLLFWLMWVISANFPIFVWRKHFLGLTTSQKAEHCARTLSIIHALFCGVGYTTMLILTGWDSDFQPKSDQVIIIRFLFSMSLGFLSVTTIIILIYRLPLWFFFSFRSALKITLLVVHNFTLACRFSTVPTSLVMLAEVVDGFANLMVLTENVNAENTKWYTLWVSSTNILWLPCKTGAYIAAVVIASISLSSQTCYGSTMTLSICLLIDSFLSYLLWILPRCFCYSDFITAVGMEKTLPQSISAVTKNTTEALQPKSSVQVLEVPVSSRRGFGRDEPGARRMAPYFYVEEERVPEHNETSNFRTRKSAIGKTD